MKWIVTGGNKGLGRRLVTHFGAESLSRVNGYDITQNAELIARESVKADVFVNNAFDGPPHEPWADFGQVQVLMAVYKQWREWKKTGYIINIGSVGSHYPSKPEPDFETYRVSKAALDYASAQCTYAFKQNSVPFRTTLIVPDRLDTPVVRTRESYTGNAISLDDICTYCEWLVSTAPNTVIEKTVMWCNLHHTIPDENKS